MTPLSLFVPAFTAFIGLFRKAEPWLMRAKGEARWGGLDVKFDYLHDSRK